MAMTQARLKKLCRGLPKINLPCPVDGCTRVVGPYFYRTNAMQALLFHLSAIHGYERNEPEEEKTKVPRSIPRTIPERAPRGSNRRHKKF